MTSKNCTGVRWAVVGSTVEEDADVFARDLDRYWKLIKRMDIKVE
jgi:hypothetical protein